MIEPLSRPCIEASHWSWAFFLASRSFPGWLLCMGMEQQVLQLISTKSKFIPLPWQYWDKRESKSSSAAWAFCELPRAKVELLGCSVYLTMNIWEQWKWDGGGSGALEQLDALLRNQPVHPRIITETWGSAFLLEQWWQWRGSWSTDGLLFSLFQCSPVKCLRALQRRGRKKTTNKRTQTTNMVSVFHCWKTNQCLCGDKQNLVYRCTLVSQSI